MKTINKITSNYSRVLLGLLISSTLGACSELGTSEGTAKDSSGPGSGISYSFDSLDVSSLSAQSSNWCELPSFTPGSFVDLDKDTLGKLLGDYALSWMTPLHEGIAAVHERSLFNASFETVFGAVLTDCNQNSPEDLEFGEDGLLDSGPRESTRNDLIELIAEGTVLSTGKTLRISLKRTCDTCDDPTIDGSFILNAQATSDGVLVLGIELQEGEPWTRKFYLTPDAMAVQFDLAQYSTWLKDYNEDTRSGTTITPNILGTVTMVARKDAQGGISGTMGIFGFKVDTRPSDADNIQVDAQATCIGMHVGADSSRGAAQAAAHLGNLTMTVPGSVSCGLDDCDEAEMNGDWVYALGGVSATVEQPNNASDKELKLQVHATSSSRASVNGKVFAEGGLGERGKGGSLSLDVDLQPAGHLVTFDPPLKLGGALTISSFSEKYQLSLPTWLEDEIFDLTFGGAPAASVFVPARKMCNDFSVNPDGMDPPISERREVTIISGALDATGGSKVRRASAGQCVGASLEDEASYTSVADWIDTGFVCE